MPNVIGESKPLTWEEKKIKAEYLDWWIAKAKGEIIGLQMDIRCWEDQKKRLWEI